MIMKPSLKTIIESDNWFITKALPGYNKRVRIDAKTRFRTPDGINSYSEWHSIAYVNRLRHAIGKCSIQESNAWHY